ncbi:MAG TPA: hypothetical protein VMT38_04805 [Terracidiphilus sp.]|nr:hypothetical protein [Terracidiphilus sp.]
MKKIALLVLLALCLAPVVSTAQDEQGPRIAPPVPLTETPGNPPHEGWVWIHGHHHWDGQHYAWVKGHWAEPPHPGDVWVPHHWEKKGDDWVLIHGHWESPPVHH